MLVATQYVGYSRNMVLAIKGHLARVGEDRCAFARTMVFANKVRGHREAACCFMTAVLCYCCPAAFALICLFFYANVHEDSCIYCLRPLHTSSHLR